MDSNAAKKGLTSDTTASDKSEQVNAYRSLNQWQMLSPIAIVYFAASSVKHLFGNALFLIPVLAINYKSILQHPTVWLPSIAALLTVFVLLAIVNYKVYRFKLSDDNIEIRSGLFNKKYLNLPFERVQNVKLEQPIYYRFTGHVCIQLDSAGSAKSEAKIIALRSEFAEHLKTHILNYAQSTNEAGGQAQGQSASPNDNLHSVSATTQNETCLNTRSLNDLIIHGITSNRIWIFLGGLAPFYDNIAGFINQFLVRLGIDFKALFTLQANSIVEIALYAVSLTILIMLLLVGFSVLGSIISFHGYTLNKIDDRYIRRSGLLTKHEVSMRLSRLQMIIRKQDWLDLLLKRINLTFEQNSSIEANNQHLATNNKIIVPSIKIEECHQLTNDAYPETIWRHIYKITISLQSAAIFCLNI
ncbi:PH domain-containing protein [Paraglaciecola aquimarina]|uniref:PH domain-containing protein n=1 Tax=Paraglaciecola aquimarina TaxID=1235557 RepID=A0ABU3SXX2_9ALTE|nr:PH domain-containing protein [Paraglaciecola aquimarina]MDU0354868.1 PH domain-containing protein [Paraglaciecola aquimarina]